MSSPSPLLEPYKMDLLETCISNDILKFGTFTLKSGRQSPYFLNTGLFYRADLARALSTAYAKTLISHTNPKLEFDVIFGPAYKGVPLAVSAADQLAAKAPDRFGQVSFSFNRKEAKDHGEGGVVVGAPLKGQRVLIIDDVVTAGTAKREAIELIKKEGGTLVGIVVALDRMEKRPADVSRGESEDDGVERESAIGALRRELGPDVPVISVLTLKDVIDALRTRKMDKEVDACEEYWKRYRAND